MAVRSRASEFPPEASTKGQNAVFGSVAYIALAAWMVALAGNVRCLFHRFALCTAILLAVSHLATTGGMRALLATSLVSHFRFLFRAEAGVYHSGQPL